MSPDAKFILKRSGRAERWEMQERGDYNLGRFREEFRKRLYSDHGGGLPSAQATRPTERRSGQDK